jgi:hypothetical protein
MDVDQHAALPFPRSLLGFAGSTKARRPAPSFTGAPYI